MRALGLGLLALGTVALAACQVLPAPASAGLQGAVGGVRVQGRVAVVAPAAQPGLAFRLQDWDVPTPPQAKEVAWVGLHLTRDGASPTEVDLGLLPGLDTPIVLNQLRPSTAYLLRLEAFDANMARLDDPATGCSTLFQTGEAPVETGFQFQLKLKDAIFIAKREVSLNPSAGLVDQAAPGGPSFVSRDVPTVLPGRELSPYGNPILLNLGAPEGYVLANIVNTTGPSSATEYTLSFPEGAPDKLACHLSGGQLTVTLDQSTLLTTPYRMAHYGTFIYFLQALELATHHQNNGNSYFCPL